MIGPHVFGDDRLGCWVMPRDDPTQFSDKLRHVVSVLPKFEPGDITDLFLPREAQPSDMAYVRNQTDYFAHMWSTPHGLDAKAYAAEVLSDFTRLKPGAVELNVEMGRDEDLAPFIAEVHNLIRLVRPSMRLRFNVVPFKGKLLPVQVFAHPHTFLIAQAYLGNMDMRLSESDTLLDLLDAGVPIGKCAVMYGAHVGKTVDTREPVLPNWIRRRGSIYSDDLLIDAGYV